MPSSLFSTVLGVTAAGVLLYAMHEAMQDQTFFMINSLQDKTDAVKRVGQVDKATGKRTEPNLASAFQPPQPSFWEEHHITKAIQTMQGASVSARVPVTAEEPAMSVMGAVRALAPRAVDAQPHVGILHRRYGDANTHYIGQGASLR
ncbi:hypothetical protein MVES_001363 [Malassezia vespertilionis]|uniref:Altered inheritance of mitochondria protein 5, mitochondrial n=1 Tax=Malassezia vespertilionis TaxID=2020962 RepID=A0A2N1JF28_9BASI|nr:hypothetical protein MVES_001363 [Malassezia vespertilionis]